MARKPWFKEAVQRINAEVELRYKLTLKEGHEHLTHDTLMGIIAECHEEHCDGDRRIEKSRRKDDVVLESNNGAGRVRKGPRSIQPSDADPDDLASHV